MTFLLSANTVAIKELARLHLCDFFTDLLLNLWVSQSKLPVLSIQCFLTVNVRGINLDPCAAYEETREYDLSVLFHTGLETWLQRHQLASFLVTQGGRPDLVYGPLGERDDLVRWTDEAEDRFYVSEAYDRNKKQFRQGDWDIGTSYRTNVRWKFSF